VNRPPCRAEGIRARGREERTDHEFTPGWPVQRHAVLYHPYQVGTRL
jgi:hypothetical protein